MMQTLNPYNTAKTAEIMARYRPIAPKPEASPSGDDNNSNSLPEGIRRSPYLMSVWNNLQARPTRTRKRGRTALGPPLLKRTRTPTTPCFPPPPYHHQVNINVPPPPKTLSFQGFVHDPTALPSLSFIPNLVPLKCGMDTPLTTPSNTLSLPLQTSNILFPLQHIDLNKAAEAEAESSEEEEEVDHFIPQFAVITPRAVRPVGSSISVGRITEDQRARNNAGKQVVKKQDEVEKLVESETLPAVISDSNNKVRLTNAAYNAMIGQPECSWLDLMSAGGACRRRRIGGEVVLDFVNSSFLPKTANGFTCWVRIEWGNDGKKKNVVNAFCDGVRLACESKDYLFEWRFHIREASESGSNV